MRVHVRTVCTSVGIGKRALQRIEDDLNADDIDGRP
jgi:hypothetical protein